MLNIFDKKGNLSGQERNEPNRGIKRKLNEVTHYS